MFLEADVPGGTTWVCDWCGRQQREPGGYPPGDWTVYRQPKPGPFVSFFMQHQCPACAAGGYRGRGSATNAEVETR